MSACRHVDWVWVRNGNETGNARDSKWCVRCGALRRPDQRWRSPVGKRRPRRDTAKRKAAPASTAVQLPFAYNQEEN
jgi:hypothetical protein